MSFHSPLPASPDSPDIHECPPSSTAAGPERRRADFELLSRPQRHQMVVEWNDCRRAYPRGWLLHRLFEARAAESPDAVAVVSGSSHLTYAELDRLAGLLARHLRSVGVGPEVLVGLCLEGGLELPQGILAVLKSGGAYVPLDPAYPARRLRFMSREAGVSVLLTRRRLCRWRDAERTVAFCLDPGWQRRLEPGAAMSAAAPVNEHGRAYVIFTSGSTGRPKGVAVCHRAVVNRLRWSQETLPLAPTDRVLQQASPSFDFSVWELFAPWMAGAVVILVPADRRRDLSRLADLVREAGVTVLHFVPALLAEILETSGVERFSWLRRVFSGGEVLSAELRDRVRSRLGAELVNQYGPTEATIDATFWRCRRGDNRPVVPIGRPIANTRILVLDPRLQPVPAGLVGEIHIAGEGLARGYVARSALTAVSFIPDPWAREPGVRLYRTGDLARYLGDGSLHFAGRRDHQVKVRGLRIELGEIEAVLERRPDVRRAVVLAVNAGVAGDLRLVACVVPDRSQTAVCTTGALDGWLKRQLPDYMIPAMFLILDTLPLTPTGKVDLRLLSRRAERSLRSDPAFDPSRADAASFTAPRNPREEILAEIWSEVLGVAPIGIHDHFFELGGHSLLAGRVVSRVRRIFHLELSVRQLFEQPTVAELARGLEAARNLVCPPPGECRPATATTAPPIVPGPRPSVLPLSFAQERLWFLDQLEPLSAAYNLPAAARLAGPLDTGALERSLREITLRHEVLRTSFPSVDGKPCQEISRRTTLRLAIVDLERLAPERRQTQMHALAAAEAARPFDLVRGPLLRAALLRLGPREGGPDEHVLLITLHHIVSDGWSRGILNRELTALYEALAGGAASGLPELPIQVADVALWQRRWLRGEALAKRLAYWRRQLGERPAALELPTDRPRPARMSHRGVSHRWALGEPLTVALKKLGITAGTSLYMTLLAAFMVLLHRLTQQREILIGSPIAGRGSGATEDLIGLFVNTLVMRGKLDDEPSFAEHLARVRMTALGAYAHHELPFEKLVEELQPERDPSRNPLFQVTLVLHNAPRSEPRLAGLELRPLDAETCLARFDLALYFRDREGDLRGSMIAPEDLFDTTTVARFCHAFESLLRGAVADPDRRVTSLPILSRAQRHQLIVEWAGFSPAPLSPDDDTPECLHHLFEAQVSRAPDSVALVSGDQRLSYRQLDRRADRLASAVRAELVAICLERSPETVVAMMAILKAKGAYLFLDPAYPRARRLLLLADAGARLLLTSESLARDFDPWDGEIVHLDPDSFRRRGAPARTPPPASRVSPRHPACVTYTSGSTGRAKGVVCTHQGAVSYLRFITEAYGLGPADVALQIAPLTFDRSVRDLLAPLVAGATVILSGAAGERPEGIPREVADHRVTCLLGMVPSLLRQIAAMAGASAPRKGTSGRVPDVRLVLFAGESFTWPDSRIAARLFGRQARLVNLYGPTEGTCTASSHTLTAPDQGGGPVAVGRPHPHVSIRLLDRALRPLPAGAAGELTLAGVGLARGYLGQPSVTARFFVPSPFAGEPGARLYRTGDLARHRRDGNLELLGRIDHQLKIRGFRIEPAEVEAALAAHPALRAAVVAGREHIPGDQRLAAYVLMASPPRGASGTGEAPSAGELRRFLRRTLPDYLVPSVFVPLDKLPLTASGKVDRAALARRPAPAPLRADPGSSAPPRDPIEEILTEIWSEFLGVERIGIRDNFFELGGHSLLATRVISRIRRLFDLELPLRRLFERPTVAGLARAMAEEQPGAATALEIGTRPSQLPLSFAQERMWFLDQLEPMSPAYNMASAWHLTGRLEPDALERSLREISRRHEVLRTRFPTIGDRPCQVIAPGPTMALPLVDLGRLAPERWRREARSLAAEEAARPFDLARGPMLRTALLRLCGEQHVLLLTVHHIVSDAWSQGNLYRELEIFYQEYSDSDPRRGTGGRRAPELPVQYADYALWQRGRMRGAALDAQLSYWKRQLGGSPPPLRLPTDRPRSAARSGRSGTVTRSGTVSLTLPSKVIEPLKQLSSTAGATLFMSLLAAFATLLSRYSAQRDIIVGTPIANRGRAEIEPLIGMFANTLVLRTDLCPDAEDPPRLATGERAVSFRKLLERVRQTALQAYAHQETPFERLVGALRPARGRTSSPLFQVMFALLNAPIDPLEIPGLECVPLKTARPTAKFDLSLTFRETAAGLEGELIYMAELFDAIRIRRMACHLQTLIGALVRNPDRSLLQLPLLSAAERQQIVVEWNDTRTEHGDRRCLHRLVESQVARTPDRIALVFEDQRLTYRQIDRHAGRIARNLTALGIGRGDYVAVLMRPCLEVPIAFLAIMKSGAAYVPLDVRWPRQRTAKILDDLKSKVVLVDSSVVPLRGNDSRPTAARERTLLIDVSLAARRGQAAKPVEFTSGPRAGSTRAGGPRVPVALEDAIYAIYTSGSTGEPKASINTHGGIVNRFLWMDRQYGRDRDRVVLQTTNHTFDSSIWQLFWPLLHGGRSVLPAMREGWDLDDLIGVVERQRVTFSDFVPSVFDVLVHRLEQTPRLRRRVASLRQLVIGGEAINLRAIGRFRRLFPEVAFTNLYGPTETAIGVIFFQIPEHLSEPIPIGKPIDNVAALILDPELGPVPVGVPGEIHLGGVCVGLGYLNDPERTAGAFIDNPLPEVRGGKLYKTGDLARFRPDGNIEFLGRTDDQIKIRGFRVEPAEIESALVRHPAIREAAIVVAQDPPGAAAGDRRLIACVVPQREGLESAATVPPEGGERLAAADSAATGRPAAISGVELRAFLERELPRHMVPSELVLLEALPLTPCGKVDRVVLSRVASSRAEAGDTSPLEGAGETDLPAHHELRLVLPPDELSPDELPRTPVERRLAAVFSEVLGLERVGVRADFFALGGHSLLAVRLMTGIERRFQVRLPLSLLFDRPTIEGLAARIMEGGSVPDSPLVPIRTAAHSPPGSDRPPFFCVHPVGGQVLCYRELASHLHAEQPFYGLRAWGSGAGEAFDPEIADMAARYSAAIQSLQPRGPYRLGGWSMGGAVAFEIAHRLSRRGEKIDALVLIDTSAPSGRRPTDAGDLTPRLRAFAGDLGLVARRAQLSARLAGMGLDDGLRRILHDARRAGIFSADIDLERILELYRLFENNLRAVRSHVPSTYPGRVTLLRSSKRPSAGDLTLGWGLLAAGGVDVRTVPGDHFTMLREPHVRVLAERLKECLCNQIRDP